jgi:hypothetical protein
VGRLSEERFTKYYCNKCQKEYPGSPAISYESPNQEMGEGIILIEKGEYKCKTCNNLLALYRRFNNKFGKFYPDALSLFLLLFLGWFYVSKV